MSAMIGWECNFCHKFGLVMSRAGTIYCPYCRMSYGKTLLDIWLENIRNRQHQHT